MAVLDRRGKHIQELSFDIEYKWEFEPTDDTHS